MGIGIVTCEMIYTSHVHFVQAQRQSRSLVGQYNLTRLVGVYCSIPIRQSHYLEPELEPKEP